MKRCCTTADENTVIGTVLRAVASAFDNHHVIITKHARYRSQYRTRVATSVVIFRTGLTRFLQDEQDDS